MLGDNARIEDLKTQLTKDISGAKLPLYVLEYVLGELHEQVQKQRIKVVQSERQSWQHECAVAKKKAEQAEAQTAPEHTPPDTPGD